MPDRDFAAELASCDRWIAADQAAVAKWERLGLRYEAEQARSALQAHLELKERIQRTEAVWPLVDAGEPLPEWYRHSR